MNRFICTLSLVALWCAVPASLAFASFSDVPDNYPNADAIAYMQAQHIVIGYPDGTYHPEHSITRAEFTKIIVAMQFSVDELQACMQGGHHTFSDTDETAWYAPFLCVATEHGIVVGYPDGTFQPAGFIDFAEASKIIVKAIGSGSLTEGSIWYEPYVRFLAQHNAIPISITALDNPSLTRGEMAEILFRLKTGNTSKPSRSFESFMQTPALALTGATITSDAMQPRKGYASFDQPAFFDPSLIKFQPTQGDDKKRGDFQFNSDALSDPNQSHSFYVSMLKKQLPTPYEATVYKFSNADYAIELRKGGSRQNLYTQVRHYAFSAENLFLNNNVQAADGSWQNVRSVVDIVQDRKINLPNMECVGNGQWEGDTLVTYSVPGEFQDYPGIDPAYATKICVWSFADGTYHLEHQLMAKMYWDNSITRLQSTMAIAPQEASAFVIYTPIFDGQRFQCSLFIQDLTQPSHQESMTVQQGALSTAVNKGMFTNGDSLPDCSGSTPCNDCPNLDLDLSQFTFTSPTIRYRMRSYDSHTERYSPIGDWVTLP